MARNHYSIYGDTFAEVYDDWYADRSNSESIVNFLATLVGSGDALELGVGTGHVAIPLAARHVTVFGIEGSPSMMAQLRAKEGSEKISVVLGDFADVGIDRDFDLIYISFSSLFLLPSQRDQVRCIENVARHLRAKGSFVLDGFVPDSGRYTNFQSVSVENISQGSVRLDIAMHDPVAQTINSTRVLVSREKIQLYPYALRYAYPSELDLMAEIAGLNLVARYGDYERAKFSKTSSMHVSVYAKA